MKTPAVALIQALVLVGWLGVPPQAQDDEALKKDLTAVIALHGLPCGQVIDVKVLADSDYAATCSDGNRYHVYLNAEGRVVVEPQK
ncbi:MAG: hypothetical protein OEW19_19235 [Acidobacteriota bacterium]|nr:hypothetical protein [Acidobacteriota bacterium]